MGQARRDYSRVHYPDQPGPRKPIGPLLWIVLALGVALLYMQTSGAFKTSLYSEPSPTTRIGQASTTNQPFPPTNTVPFPPSGQQRWFVPQPSINSYATLSIIAPASVSQNFTIDVDSWETGQPTVTVFLRGGDATFVNLPLGIYRLVVSFGPNWYGDPLGFGTTSVPEETTIPISLYRENNVTFGSTFYLQQVLGGNMPMEPIQNQSDR